MHCLIVPYPFFIMSVSSPDSPTIHLNDNSHKPIGTLSLLLVILSAIVIALYTPDIISKSKVIDALDIVQQQNNFINGQSTQEIAEDTLMQSIDILQHLDEPEISGLIQTGILLVYRLVFFIWIWRSASNAIRHASGKVDFTRAQSVYYFFIPFINLWKPYMCVKRIWNLSKNSEISRMKTGSLFILAWWTAEIASQTASIRDFQFALKINSMADPSIHIIKNYYMNMYISDLLLITSILFTLGLIYGIYSSQKKWIMSGMSAFRLHEEKRLYLLSNDKKES